MAELKEVLDLLRTVAGKVDESLKWQAVHTEHHKQTNADLKEARVAVFGHPGNPGRRDSLQFKVDRLWECKKRLLTWREFWAGVLKIVAAAAILAVLTWSLGLYKGTQNGNKQQVRIEQEN